MARWFGVGGRGIGLLSRGRKVYRQEGKGYWNEVVMMKYLEW
jgi:hypothetical protein